MLVFASRASTQAVRALSSAVRRVEAGQVDADVLRLDTGDEIGELSAVVERYVRQSRDLRDNLEETVRAKTQRLEALHHIDRSILAAESAEAIARGALPRLRSDRAVPAGAPSLLFEREHRARRASWRRTATGGPRRGRHGARVRGDGRAAPRRRPEPHRRAAGGGWRSPSACCASGQPEPGGFDDDHAEIVGEVANQLAVAIHQGAAARGARPAAAAAAGSGRAPTGGRGPARARRPDRPRQSPRARTTWPPVATRHAGRPRDRRSAACRSSAPARRRRSIEPREITAEHGVARLPGGGAAARDAARAPSW